MIVIVSFVTGALLGALRARARGGNRLDMAQYAAVFGILIGLAGLVVTVMIDRAV